MANTILMGELKYCNHCSTLQWLTFFNKDAKQPDGYHVWCKDCSREACRKSYRKHEEAHKRLKRRWKAENRIRVIKINKEWQSENVRRANAASANHRARKLGAMPAWADIEGIYLAYELCPPGFHVDHIHPLKGKDFCGLHVPHNLQFLPALENFKKNNRLQEIGQHV